MCKWSGGITEQLEGSRWTVPSVVPEVVWYKVRDSEPPRCKGWVPGPVFPELRDPVWGWRDVVDTPPLSQEVPGVLRGLPVVNEGSSEQVSPSRRQIGRRPAPLPPNPPGVSLSLRFPLPVRVNSNVRDLCVCVVVCVCVCPGARLRRCRCTPLCFSCCPCEPLCVHVFTPLHVYLVVRVNIYAIKGCKPLYSNVVACDRTRMPSGGGRTDSFLMCNLVQ